MVPEQDSAGIGSARSTASSPPTPAKSILLFSDGTGNSSAKLFKTNVFRLYEAADLGPAGPGKQRQIAYYDDGVGSSAFKPLALLGGVFGYGLKRNVLQIYTYACRNYDAHSVAPLASGIEDAGDHIYGFGFSRGAFTMRLVIAMIADQGIIPYKDEADLEWRVEAAYTVFRRFRTRRAVQWLRDRFGRRYDPERVTRRVRRKTGYDPEDNHRPVIRFIGVWDTVAAYGGPIVELTRAIDNWFYPLSMPDYRLSVHVRRARHALALDDERDSFWPLLWDEVAEARLRAKPPENITWIDGDRLQQVWFSGMHADVGGGYPDESLSYVSLLWMIEEAHLCDLRTVDLVTERYRALVNSFGPLHDSRSGLGSYYRYQPRKIAAWLDPVRDSTLSLRDPEIRDDALNRPQGLIAAPAIHESAIARVASGTDGYAPIVLPDTFTIVPPGDLKETAGLETTGGEVDRSAAATGVPPRLLPREIHDRLDPAVTRRIAAAMEHAWDGVWYRRVAFFLNVAATSALFGWPLLTRPIPNKLVEGGIDPGWSLFVDNVRESLGKLILLAASPLPNFLDRWTSAWAASPFIVLGLLALIWVLRSFGSRLERDLRDQSRAIWHRAVPRIPPGTAGEPPRGVDDYRPSRLAGFRNSPTFQRALQILKWSIFPNLAALAMALVALFVLVATLTQIAVPFMETSRRFCSNDQPVSAQFTTAALCDNTGVDVVGERDYIIRLTVTEGWRDGSYATDPKGVSARDMPILVGYPGALLRRVVAARYLQPVAEVRWTMRASNKQGAALRALDFTPVPNAAGAFEAPFRAPVNGRLFLFANDAVSLIDPDYFYTAGRARNAGAATVTVTAVR